MDKVQLTPADMPVLQFRIECAELELLKFHDVGPMARRCLENKIAQMQEQIKYLETHLKGNHEL